MEFYVLMDIIIIIFGGYIIYQYVLMKKDGTIKASMLLPKDLNVKRCKDVQGYIQFIGPKQLAFGVTALICGVIGLVQDMTGWNSMIVYIPSIVICLACVVWYTRSMKKAIKEFWK